MDVSAARQWLLDNSHYAGTRCLTWPFYRSEQGYGRVRVKGLVGYAHIEMCKLRHGQAPADKAYAIHTCHNGHLGCVNPNHLRWGSQKENMSSRFVDGKYFPYQKLTPQAVRYIIDQRGKATQMSLADKFGVTQSHISRVQSGGRGVTTTVANRRL